MNPMNPSEKLFLTLALVLTVDELKNDPPDRVRATKEMALQVAEKLDLLDELSVAITLGSPTFEDSENEFLRKAVETDILPIEVYEEYLERRYALQGD